MSTYKAKRKQFIIDASKYPQYYFIDDCVVFNLNACFTKKDNYLKFLSNLKETREVCTKINLCNLASMCYKFGITYASNETLDFVSLLKSYITQDTDFQIIQNNIVNCEETDLRPLQSLVQIDSGNEIIYVNTILIQCLDILGYTSTQIFDVMDFSKDLNQVIPIDLIETLPIENKVNLGCYKLIQEILC